MSCSSCAVCLCLWLDEDDRPGSVLTGFLAPLLLALLLLWLLPPALEVLFFFFFDDSDDEDAAEGRADEGDLDRELDNDGDEDLALEAASEEDAPPPVSGRPRLLLRLPVVAADKDDFALPGADFRVGNPLPMGMADIVLFRVVMFCLFIVLFCADVLLCIVYQGEKSFAWMFRASSI